MKKIILSVAACVAAISMNAQTTYFSDDFDDLDISDWTLYDQDGDGFNWSAVQIQDQGGNPVGSPVLRSASWSQTIGALTPDNFAVSPPIDLTSEDGTKTITLHWEVAAADANYANENYTVYVAAGSQVNDFLNSSTSFNEVVTDNGPGGLENFYQKDLDITSFAGQVVYVAFRHHITSDQFTIEIDNVSVVAENLGTENNQIAGFDYFYSSQNNVLTLIADEPFSNIELYNILGQRVMAQELSNTEENLSLSSLNTGIYLANVNVNGKVSTFKIVKK